jgi:hypothetical protein
MNPNLSKQDYLLLSTALRKIVATLNAEGRGGKRKGVQSFGTGILP